MLWLKSLNHDQITYTLQESAEEDEEGEDDEVEPQLPVVNEESEDQNTSTDERLSALLRRKLELETVQNELKQLRDQQQLLSNMEQVRHELVKISVLPWFFSFFFTKIHRN